MSVNSFFSKGDIIDLYHLARLKGMRFVFKNFSLTKKGRTRSKWNRFQCSNSDFWVIPQIKERWNEKCTGDPELEYEDHVCKKYLNGLQNLKMLSVGCGNSSHEQAFSKHACFSSVLGIDNSSGQLSRAKKYAEEENYRNVTYKISDFETDIFPNESFDVILFHSSLHHFKNIKKIISQKTLPILKSKGLVVIFDYTGPNRLQWTNAQLEKGNELLNFLPLKYKIYFDSNSHKTKIYRPGLLRMSISDPSEAADSESILSVLHENFNVLEEKKLGCNLLHPALKGISHHFTDNSAETNSILKKLFEMDDDFVEQTGKSDFTFGVYQKKN